MGLDEIIHLLVIAEYTKGYTGIGVRCPSPAWFGFARGVSLSSEQKVIGKFLPNTLAVLHNCVVRRGGAGCCSVKQADLLSCLGN